MKYVVACRAGFHSAAPGWNKENSSQIAPWRFSCHSWYLLLLLMKSFLGSKEHGRGQRLYWTKNHYVTSQVTSPRSFSVHYYNNTIFKRNELDSMSICFVTRIHQQSIRFLALRSHNRGAWNTQTPITLTSLTAAWNKLLILLKT